MLNVNLTTCMFLNLKLNLFSFKTYHSKMIKNMHKFIIKNELNVSVYNSITNYIHLLNFAGSKTFLYNKIHESRLNSSLKKLIIGTFSFLTAPVFF